MSTPSSNLGWRLAGWWRVGAGPVGSPAGAAALPADELLEFAGSDEADTAPSGATDWRGDEGMAMLARFAAATRVAPVADEALAEATLNRYVNGLRHRERRWRQVCAILTMMARDERDAWKS